MKLILLVFMLAAGSLKAICQPIADPATGQMDLLSLGGVSQNANFLAPNGVVRLQIPLYNLNQLNTIPAGRCLINIRLGFNMVLDPFFDIATAPLNNYFAWSAATISGQVVITGNQIAPLPGDFTAIAEFRVQGTVLGTSEINNRILVSDLTDEDPDNNVSLLQYTVTNLTIPVSFTSITARRDACNINVQFSAENEINVGRYEIEASKDGISYAKVGQLTANRSINYQYLFAISAATESAALRIRVKSVDWDGKVQYTPVVTVKGNCRGDLAGQLYPNPLPQQKTKLTIDAVSGQFNGRYTIVLTDAVGRALRTGTVHLANTQQWVYDAGYLAAGHYILQLQSAATGDKPLVLRFQKL